MRRSRANGFASWSYAAQRRAGAVDDLSDAHRCALNDEDAQRAGKHVGVHIRWGHPGSFAPKSLIIRMAVKFRQGIRRGGIEVRMAGSAACAREDLKPADTLERDFNMAAVQARTVAALA